MKRFMIFIIATASLWLSHGIAHSDELIFSDDFERANIGADWITGANPGHSDTITIVGGRVQATDNGNFIETVQEFSGYLRIEMDVEMVGTNQHGCWDFAIALKDYYDYTGILRFDTSGVDGAALGKFIGADSICGNHVTIDGSAINKGKAIFTYQYETVRFSFENDDGDILDAGSIYAGNFDSRRIRIYLAAYPDSPRYVDNVKVYSLPGQPSEVWVDDDYCNVCPNDGHTWNYDAFDNIQDGIDAVTSPGTVNVAAGIYEGRVVLKTQVSLLGAGIGVSIIDGMGLKEGDEDRVVAMASDSKISGFSIIYGGWNGVECRGVSAVVEGNLVAHHEAIGIALIGYGSRNSIVSNNIVTDCASYEPKLQFVGAIFGNSVYGSPQIIHNTVVGNHYTGIGFCHPGTPIIKNNIVVGNLEGIGVCDNVDPNNSHNNSWNNEVYNWRGVEKGEGAISSNPLFVDEIEGDYHLQKGSPCIDAGTSENTSDTDFEGDSRPQGYGIEMGADEIVVPLGYTPVAPCRIVDTRKAGGIIFESTERDFHVYGSSDTISAQGGNPTGCEAPMGEPLSAHINMIAVNPTGKGNLQAFPVGAGTGAGLSVNYNTIDTNLANAGTVKAVTGTGPDITVASNFSSAHTVIDVLGYYYQEAGLLYAPVMPCRIVDTRYTSAGIIDADTERNFRVFGSGGVIFAQGGDLDGCLSPLGEPLAAHINMVAVYPYGKGNLQAFPLGAENGAGLSVNYNILDTNLANAGIVKTNEGAGADITVASNFSSANTVIDVLGYFYPDGDLLYTPVTPCRIVDTRKTLAGIIDANTERNFRVFGSGGTISGQGGNSTGCPAPMDEPLAAHINMVAVNPTGKGNLQAFPLGAGPGAGLSVNYNTIDTNLANAGTIKTVTGSGADITVASNFSSAHTVIDVLGYYYSAP